MNSSDMEEPLGVSQAIAATVIPQSLTHTLFQWSTSSEAGPFFLPFMIRSPPTSAISQIRLCCILNASSELMYSYHLEACRQERQGPPRQM